MAESFPSINHLICLKNIRKLLLLINYLDIVNDVKAA